MEKLISIIPLKRTLNKASAKKVDDKLKTSCNYKESEVGIKELLIRLNQERDLSLPKSVVTSQKFVKAYNTFTKYYGTQFSQSQYKNNCTATLTANVLSYYKTVRGVNLYPETITQSVYDMICSNINYSTSGASNILNIIEGLKKISMKKNKDCIFRKYRYNWWSDITWDIDDNKIIMLGYKDHAYLIVGYRIINGTQQVYTFTGWSYLPYKWIDYDTKMSMASVYIS